MLSIQRLLLVSLGSMALVYPSFAQRDEPVPRSFFGMHIHRIVPNDLWRGAGFGAVRLHDANVTWLDIEPSPGSWRFERLDAIVDKLERSGKQILLPLQATPAWASALPTSTGAYGPGANVLPANPDHWIRYVTTVAQRYRGRIAAYSIWNEPNLPKFYLGSPETLSELTVRTALALRAVDPGAIVVCAGITGSYGIGWLRRYLAAGAGQTCDVLAYHLYTKHEPPERMLPTIRAVRGVMRELGLLDKPLWNTETGWLIEQPGGVDVRSAGFTEGVKVLDDATAAAYVVRAHALAWAADVERFYWYSWDHPAMGLSAQRGVFPTRVGRTYSALVETLVGSRLRDCGQAGGLWTCTLLMPGTISARLVWVEVGAARMTVEKGMRVREFAEDGSMRSAIVVETTGQIAVGIMPRLVFDR